MSLEDFTTGSEDLTTAAQDQLSALEETGHGFTVEGASKEEEEESETGIMENLN